MDQFCKLVHTIKSMVFIRLLVTVSNRLKARDHVYVVHPSTDTSGNISTDSRQMYRSTYRSSIDRYVDRHIGRESVDMSTEMCRSTYRPTYRSSTGRYVDRHSTDMLADTSTESDFPIVGRHVDRYIGYRHSADTSLLLVLVA